METRERGWRITKVGMEKHGGLVTGHGGQKKGGGKEVEGGSVAD